MSPEWKARPLWARRYDSRAESLAPAADAAELTPRQGQLERLTPLQLLIRAMRPPSFYSSQRKGEL